MRRIEPSPPTDAHAAAEIVAITTEDDFLLELGAVLGRQAAVLPIESVAPALEHVGASHRAHILVIDTRGMDDLRDSVGRAFARAADAIVLLFAHAAEVASMRQAFNGSKVFAVLPIPIDAARTALAFAEALAGALAQQAAVPMLPETSPVNPKSQRTLRENRWAAGVGLAVLLLAAAPGFIPRGKKPSAPSAGTEVSVPAAPATLVKGQVDELLEGSRTAMGPEGG